MELLWIFWHFAFAEKRCYKIYSCEIQGCIYLVNNGKLYTTSQCIFFFFLQGSLRNTSMQYQKCSGSHWAFSMIATFILWKFYNHLTHSPYTTTTTKLKTEPIPSVYQSTILYGIICVFASSLEYHLVTWLWPETQIGDYFLKYLEVRKFMFARASFIV